jgi:integrase
LLHILKYPTSGLLKYPSRRRAIAGTMAVLFALIRGILTRLSGTGKKCPASDAQLLYGTGMRLLEALRLRVKDVEFARREIVIREGKGNKDRVTVLPENLVLPLQQQLQKARALHET